MRQLEPMRLAGNRTPRSVKSCCNLKKCPAFRVHDAKTVEGLHCPVECHAASASA